MASSLSSMQRACALVPSCSSRCDQARLSMSSLGRSPQQYPLHMVGHARTCSITVTRRATPDKQQEPQDPNIVEGYDITKPDIWESTFVGTALQVGLVAFSVGLVVTLLYLATPLITYVVDIYPSPEALTQGNPEGASFGEEAFSDFTPPAEFSTPSPSQDTPIWEPTLLE